MSGIRMVYDDTSAQRAAAAIIAEVSDLTSAMRSIGEHMLRETDERFRIERDPQGRAWAPLSDVTLEMKKNDKILTESTDLRSNISYDEGTKSVTIGTGPGQWAYAAIHQYGGKAGPGRKVDIPARTYLGVSVDDLRECADIIAEHIGGDYAG